MFDIVTFVASAAIATSGTQAVNYPINRDSGAYSIVGHVARVRGMANNLELNSGFNLTFGTSSITFTYRGTTSIPAGATIVLQLNRKGADGDLPKRVSSVFDNVAMQSLFKVVLGAPDAAVSNGVCLSQTINTTATLNGSLVVGTAAVFDVPRNVVAAWTTTATITITGTDEYGNVVKETSASGTSHAGKKAFKTVTSVISSTSITLATVGTGDVLGLPVALIGAGFVLKELQDNVAATAGTLVAADTATATALTGDVRGTYDPNAACDAAKAFDLIIATDDPTYRGVSQFAG